MQFNLATILLALGAGASFVAAAPAENLVARKELQGKCDGTKCAYDGQLYECSFSTSCVGAGGGDGAACVGLSATDKRFSCPVVNSKKLLARKELQGKCNGTKCQYDGTNYPCSFGTSCVGAGGGDGASCVGLSASDKRFSCPVQG